MINFPLKSDIFGLISLTVNRGFNLKLMSIKISYSSNFIKLDGHRITLLL